MTHLGRPTEGEPKPDDSLAPVARPPGRAAEQAGAGGGRLANWPQPSNAGEVVMLENVRLNKGREEKQRDLGPPRARCDVFVSERLAPLTAPKPPPTPPAKVCPAGLRAAS